jgi:hypothetical protein
MFLYSPQGVQNIISSKLRRRLKHAADLLEALACDDSPIETMQEPGSAYSGTDHVDMASGQIGVSGSAWQVNVDAQVKLHEAALREVAKIRKLLAELDSASADEADAGWKPLRAAKRMPEPPQLRRVR